MKKQQHQKKNISFEIALKPRPKTDANNATCIKMSMTCSAFTYFTGFGKVAPDPL